MTQKYKVFIAASIGVLTLGAIITFAIKSTAVPKVNAELQFGDILGTQPSNITTTTPIQIGTSTNPTGLSFGEVAQQAGTSTPSDTGLLFSDLQAAQDTNNSDGLSIPEFSITEYLNKLIQQDNNAIAYWVSPAGVKIAMPTKAIFDSYGNKWEDVMKVSNEAFASIPDAKYIKLKGNGAVYRIESKTKRYVTQTAATELNIDPNVVIEVNKTEFNYYKTGAQIKSSSDIIE